MGESLPTALADRGVRLDASSGPAGRESLEDGSVERGGWITRIRLESSRFENDSETPLDQILHQSIESGDAIRMSMPGKKSACIGMNIRGARDRHPGVPLARIEVSQGSLERFVVPIRFGDHGVLHGLELDQIHVF